MGKESRETVNNAFKFENPGFNMSGERIKAGFHCHTFRSDGGLSPMETLERYHKKGFRCLGITDHRTVTGTDGAPDGMLTIPSTENGGEPDVIAAGIVKPVPPELPLAERCGSLAAQGGFTIAAHPAYCAALPGDYIDCGELMALEIYNAYCDMAYSNGYAVELWDMLLGSGKRIWGVAGDDAHLNPGKRFYSEAGLGWVEIWADDFSEKAILDSLKKGAFFSTQGPVFQEISITGNSVSLKCSPAAEVRWRTFGKVGFVDYPREGSELEVSSLPGWFKPSKFLRIELVDREGKRAWSNPVFVKG